MIEKFDQCQSSVLGVQRVAHSEVSKYGIIDANKIEERFYKVNDLTEKPAPEDAKSDIAILGRYIITPEIFNCIENTAPGAGGEIQLTDALKLLGKKEDIFAYDFEGRRYDVGNRMGFLEATVEFALDRSDLHDEFLSYIKKIVSLY